MAVTLKNLAKAKINSKEGRNLVFACHIWQKSIMDTYYKKSLYLKHQPILHDSILQKKGLL